ncbi:hypothetical protein SEEM5278_12784 [Salmonella enterica subsp. enterica serovar Montevideo str. CT_02035278]|nr:hypothetical protein SEEM315_20307 [Salmonella enterica subsp. enterica serovar Montevideo str. 315996572]EFY15870.1 hypothetical protein SEEM971_07706 [Salmonella enterica subsp. enterica serovar Montevideo str. 495297-1]EFY22067.1 hypothetical protein SEEM973_00295 [Salmonella enterica subsp. enterica serovar Montevideo str. 495297-3]EFY26865.1 hypothetical protein SEEM974_19450 [Salmonella enterica subsp. enterica serovar Montevideo str. 495297-4]EFY31019.1 hypothetical protein SEEM201_10
MYTDILLLKYNNGGGKNKQGVWENKGIKMKCLQYLIDNNEKSGN